MIYIPNKYLKPGMKLARDIFYGSHYLPLITGGQLLTERSIRKLTEYQVHGVYVEFGLSDDVVAQDFIDPSLKRDVTESLRSTFESFMEKDSISVVNYDSIRKTAKQLIMHILSKDDFLINIVDIKDYDTYTYSHSMYVGILSVLMGVKLGVNENALIDLAMGGLLHDIGKLDVPLEIVNKRGPLTNEEFRQMKKHPSNGVLRLMPCHMFSVSMLRGVETHHERFDGSGYPEGLVGTNIPLYGRILTLADVYDALTSNRPYRPAWSPSEAVEYMLGRAETQFDHSLLQIFLKTVAPYPVGTLLLLSNGSTGVVIKNRVENTLRPTVRILDPAPLSGQEIDLFSNRNYLNVTILKTLGDSGDSSFPFVPSS